MKQQKRHTLHTFTVQLAGPLDIPTSVELFRRWGDDLIDRWDGRVLVRTTRFEGRTIPFACTVIGSVEEPTIEVTVADSSHTSTVASMLNNMFVTAPESFAALAATDPVMARLETQYRGAASQVRRRTTRVVRPPGASDGGRRISPLVRARAR